ncbi:MAG: hypothetical protein K9L89_05225, partial [Kiritimatiellales bacterium]|nr:hypothetical protein [Kiritimatiellales bacterium]
VNGDDIAIATVLKHSLDNIALPPLLASLSPAMGGFEVSWNAVDGLAYSVLWTPNLTNSFQTLQSGIEPPQNSYTDTVHAAQSAGFYRVEME